MCSVELECWWVGWAFWWWVVGPVQCSFMLGTLRSFLYLLLLFIFRGKCPSFFWQMESRNLGLLCILQIHDTRDYPINKVGLSGVVSQSPYGRGSENNLSPRAAVMSNFIFLQFRKAANDACPYTQLKLMQSILGSIKIGMIIPHQHAYHHCC